MDELREKLAEQEHERWSRWMEYMLEQVPYNDDGTWTMPAWAVHRWVRQMRTPYTDLSEEEKDSDRKEADRTLALFREYFPLSLGVDSLAPTPPPGVPAGTYQKGPDNHIFFLVIGVVFFIAMIFYAVLFF